MDTIKTIMAASAIVLTTTAAFAGNKENVQVFYDLLSDPVSEELSQEFLEIASENWESIDDYSGKAKTRDEFLGQIGGFAQIVPDLNWAVEDMIETNNKVIVRSRATGTPVAPFFGVDGEGRSFDIMTIDIHELKDGMIVRTFHVEDWAGALQQLSAE